MAGVSVYPAFPSFDRSYGVVPFLAGAGYAGADDSSAPSAQCGQYSMPASRSPWQQQGLDWGDRSPESPGQRSKGPNSGSTSPPDFAAKAAAAAAVAATAPISFQAYNVQQPSVGFYRRDAGAGPAGAASGPQQHPTDVAGFNLNKSITKRLANATHYQQVLDTIADSAAYFDEVNVATALHRLAKLHSMHASGAAALIVNSPQFKLLLGQIQRLLPYFEVQFPCMLLQPL